MNRWNEIQWLLPLTVCFIVVATYVFCIIYAVAADTYIGSIPFPYFSDTGRDHPAYYVFATFLTVAAILMLAEYHSLYFTVLKPAITALDVGDSSKCCSMKCQAIAGCICGVLSAPFLAMLSILDTSFHADVHLYSAYLFFILNIFMVAIFGDLFRRIKNGMSGSTQHSKHWDMTFKVKKYVSIFFFLAFLVYIPIGLAVNCTMLRLPMNDCKAKGLGEKYCDDRFYKTVDGTALTVLYDYSQDGYFVHSSKCVDLNTMRSVAQFFSIVWLLVYIGSFSVDVKYHAGAGGAKYSPLANIVV